MAKKIDPRADAIVSIDFAQQLEEFEKGKPVGETANIPVINENFSWKRSFQNCWTGWPNDGKSTFLLFMALMKSAVNNWKWGIWSPEMYNAVLNGDSKKLIASVSDIVDEIIFMFTGRTPYKHFKSQYGISQMSKDEYVQALEWVQDHFIFTSPKDRTYKSLIDNFRYMFEHYGCDGWIGDPFKNVLHDETGRFDLYLDNVFTDTKEFAIETNTCFNWVAHPSHDKNPKDTDGSYKLCTQFMLAGGASWNNNMDGIYSIRRPFKHKDPTDPRVEFFNLKQRKQQLVGRCGVYDKIEFDFETNRYYFDEHCPLDGSKKESIATMEKRKKEAKKQLEEVKALEANSKGKKKPAEPLIDFAETKIPIEDVHETLF